MEATATRSDGTKIAISAEAAYLYGKQQIARLNESNIRLGGEATYKKPEFWVNYSHARKSYVVQDPASGRIYGEFEQEEDATRFRAACMDYIPSRKGVC